MSSADYDLVIIGAGIAGIAHAYAAAKQGMSVLVLEQNSHAQGASVRNFGMFLPIGMPQELLTEVWRSKAIWQELLQQAGLWSNPSGSLILAYLPEEMAMMQEFTQQASQFGYQCEWLNRAQVSQLSPAVNTKGLLGALYSKTEIIIDSRQVLATLPKLLTEQYGVHFQFNTTALGIHQHTIQTNRGSILADRVIVCSGSNFETLYPDEFATSGLTRCKLQMLKTVSQSSQWKMGPMLATGLSLIHYPAFQQLSSRPALHEKLAELYPELLQDGIHILVSQNGAGELIIGDSHEYGWSPSPFDREDIFEQILSHCQNIFQPPNLQIQQRWHGIYAKHPEQHCVTLTPQHHVKVITGFAGSGMTLCFGVAEQMLAQW